ncbi:hypothetical protein GVAV_003365 [Gurleya vavrai]
MYSTTRIFLLFLCLNVESILSDSEICTKNIIRYKKRRYSDANVPNDESTSSDSEICTKKIIRYKKRRHSDANISNKNRLKIKQCKILQESNEKVLKLIKESKKLFCNIVNENFKTCYNKEIKNEKIFNEMRKKKDN